MGKVFVEKLPGDGQEGEVYRSYEYAAKAVRAVKVKSRRNQFDVKPLREAENLSLLRSEHVVRFYQMWIDPSDSPLY